MIRFERHGIRWEVSTPCEPLLDNLIADPGRPVKVTPTKLVSVHAIEGRTYFVKRYRNAGVPLRPLKFFFKQSQARSEWRVAQQYVALGIPLVHHVALGERWTLTGLQESILITEGFDGVSLSRGAPHQRPDVQVALGKLLRLMHDHGVLQPDLHHNILVRVEPLELRRVDVDQGQVKLTLTDDERIDNLAWLNVNVLLSDAFFQTYGATADFIRETRRRSAIMRRASRAKFSWRSVGHNLRFEPRTIGGRKWWVRKEFFDDRLQRVLESPDRPAAGFHVQRLEGGGVFGETSALRVYRTAYHLELLGIPTQRPLAATNRYVVTEHIAGAVSLAEHLSRATRIDDALLQQVATLLACLHEEGFWFRGRTSERNFLLHDSGVVSVIGLEGLRFQRTVEEAAASADTQALAKAMDRFPLVARSGSGPFLERYREARGQLRSGVGRVC